MTPISQDKKRFAKLASDKRADIAGDHPLDFKPTRTLIAERLGSSVPGTPEHEARLGINARDLVAAMQSELVKEHSGGHRLMGQFCPVCQQSSQS